MCDLETGTRKQNKYCWNFEIIDEKIAKYKALDHGDEEVQSWQC